MIVAGSESTLLFDELLDHPHKFSLPWLHAAFVLLLVGYGTKMGLAPMHTWKPDAYGEAPGMVGALMAGGQTSCAFLALLRFSHVVHMAHDDEYAQALLVFMGLLSMGTAAVFMSRQKDIKRLLAYSSVEHMGMLVFGIGIGGLAVTGSLLHVVHNGLCKAGLFMAVGNIHRAYGSKTTDQVQGVLRRLPYSGWMLVILFFAVTGSPLFGPFVSEYQILCGTFAADRLYVGLGFLVMLLLVFFGMGRTLLGCALGSPPQVDGDPRFHEKFSTGFPIGSCAADDAHSRRLHPALLDRVGERGGQILAASSRKLCCPHRRPHPAIALKRPQNIPTRRLGAIRKLYFGACPNRQSLSVTS